MSLIIDHTKKILQGALLKFASEENLTTSSVQLLIYSETTDGAPCFKKLINYNVEQGKEKALLDFAPKSIMMGMFDIEKSVPPYLQKGLLKLAEENNCNVKYVKVIIYAIDDKAENLGIFVKFDKSLTFESFLNQ